MPIGHLTESTGFSDKTTMTKIVITSGEPGKVHKDFQKHQNSKGSDISVSLPCTHNNATQDTEEQGKNFRDLEEMLTGQQTWNTQ